MGPVAIPEFEPHPRHGWRWMLVVLDLGGDQFSECETLPIIDFGNSEVNLMTPCPYTLQIKPDGYFVSIGLADRRSFGQTVDAQ